MSASSAHAPFPRGALIGAFAMVCFAIGGAGLARLEGSATPAPITASPVASRDLRFADQPDGSIAVTDAARGMKIGSIAPETDDFLRTALHGLAYLRQQDGIGPDPAFRLTAWADGRLTLQDPSTGQSLDLEAFGPTNAGAFARFLPARTGAR